MTAHLSRKAWARATCSGTCFPKFLWQAVARWRRQVFLKVEPHLPCLFADADPHCWVILTDLANHELVHLPPDFDSHSESLQEFIKQAYDIFPSIWEEEAETERGPGRSGSTLTLMDRGRGLLVVADGKCRLEVDNRYLVGSEVVFVHCGRPPRDHKTCLFIRYSQWGPYASRTRDSPRQASLQRQTSSRRHPVSWW